jgi:hypothetical protein
MVYYFDWRQLINNFRPFSTRSEAAAAVPAMGTELFAGKADGLYQIIKSLKHK